MNVKDVVQKAKSYILDLFEGEEVLNVGLEEVDMDLLDDTWRVTIGFSRPWDKSVQSVLSGSSVFRSYKVVRISDKSGKILSVTDRNMENK